ncbi:phosphoglycerate mutase-like protein [Cystobasidium minutum MCA 4210]|uniref:phosphoglycerate mutase-like protein n=1 Tax=Cystobasidium minutum MCA 4210 TaxID=1397322 RepID=UPI0034CD7254|eukprot:jgi/Rhomi1/78035/CE78034_207
MSDKIVYLIRHCEAEHKVGRRFHIADARLTPTGVEQAKELCATLPQDLLENVELVVSSPLRRALETTLLGLQPVLDRVGRRSVVILPHAQECNIHPCDTGSAAEELVKDPAFEGLDFRMLSKRPDWTSKQGFWSNDPACLHARAKYVRRWLRDQPEKRIVLVSHGNFLRYLVSRAETDDLFANGEIRSYTFASDDDEDARVVLLQKTAKVGEVKPASDFDGSASSEA